MSCTHGAGREPNHRTPMSTSQPSYQALLGALEVGESHCFSRKLNQDDATRDDIAEAEARVANVARAQIARAKHSTGHKFTGDLISTRTPSTRDPIVIYVVTRTE